MRLIVIVPFLNEARFLPRLLASIERQTRLPDRLVLVDDGSSDGSGELADRFAARHGYAHVMRRPRRPPASDRLANASEFASFDWALTQIEEPWDVVAKLDADLDLNPRHFEIVCEQLRTDPRLGIAGAWLADVAEDGTTSRFPVPEWHVRGANKFYRLECYQQIQPIPAHLGWDMIDEVKARRAGWLTRSFELPGGDTLHLRPTGQHDGRLRAYRRWGACAWGYGMHPAFMLLGALKRSRHRPLLLCGALYAIGYVEAALRGHPRVDRELRSYLHREEAQQVVAALRWRRNRAPAGTELGPRPRGTRSGVVATNEGR